jgi:hypothetical protein
MPRTPFDPELLYEANPAAKVDNIRRPTDAEVVNRRGRELENLLELAPPRPAGSDRDRSLHGNWKGIEP